MCGAEASYFDMRQQPGPRRRQRVTYDGPGQLTAGDGSRWRTFDLRSQPQAGTTSVANTHTVSFGYHFDGYALANATNNLAKWRDGDAGARNAANGGSTQTQAVYLQDAWQLIDAVAADLRRAL